MARIETYSPQASVSVPGVPRLPGSVDAPRLGQAAAGAAAALGQKAAGQADIAQAQGYAAGQLEKFGGAVGSAGADVMAYQQQQQQIADTAWLAKATAETRLSTHISEAKLFSGAGDASVGPTGYADAATGNIKAFGEAYAKNAPSAKAKQAYENWLIGEQADAQIRAYDHQQAKQDQQSRADFLTALDSHVQLVAHDPSQFESAWVAVEHDLQAAQRWMNPDDAAELRAKTRASMELQRAVALAKDHPLDFQREVNPAQYDVASGTRGSQGWQADPHYSHLNAEQIDALSKGIKVDVTNSLRTTLAGQDQIHIQTVAANTQALHESFAQSLRAVAADPTQFDEEWAKVDLQLQQAGSWADTTALAKERAEIRQKLELQRAQAISPKQLQNEVVPGQYDAASGTGTPSKGWITNPLYSHLQPDQISNLLDTANKAVVDQHNAAVSTQNLQTAAQVEALKVAILHGQAGPVEVAEAGKTFLTKSTDIVAVNEILHKQQEDGKTLALGSSRIATGDHFNPAMPEDVKQVDAVVKASIGDNPDVLIGEKPMSVDAGQGSLAATDPMALAQMKAKQWTVLTGILAPTVVDTIRGGIVSNDPQRMMAAYQLWDKLLRDPATTAAATAAFTADDLKNYDHYTLVAPFLTGDKLVEEMSPVIDRQAKERRDTNRKAWDEQNQKDLAKGTDYMPDVLSALDPPGWGNTPIVPDSSDTARAIRDTYEEGARYAAGFTVDPVQIKAKAIEFVQREWGTTQAGSGSVVIRHPPERSFLPIRGNFDWMDQQIEGQVKSIYPGASDWAPVTLPETEGAKGIKVTPRWAIVVHESGVHHVIAPPDNGPPGWPFDYNAAYQAAQQETRDTYGSLMSVPPEVKDRAAKLQEMFIQRSGAYQDRTRARTDSSNSPFPAPVAPPVGDRSYGHVR